MAPFENTWTQRSSRGLLWDRSGAVLSGTSKPGSSLPPRSHPRTWKPDPGGGVRVPLVLWISETDQSEEWLRMVPEDPAGRSGWSFRLCWYPTWLRRPVLQPWTRSWPRPAAGSWSSRSAFGGTTRNARSALGWLPCFFHGWLRWDFWGWVSGSFFTFSTAGHPRSAFHPCPEKSPVTTPPYSLSTFFMAESALAAS